MRKIFPNCAKIMVVVTMMNLVACQKSKTCWECEVRRNDGTKYNEKVCNDGEVPAFTDSNGNDLNAYCKKR